MLDGCNVGYGSPVKQQAYQHQGHDNEIQIDRTVAAFQLQNEGEDAESGKSDVENPRMIKLCTQSVGRFGGDLRLVFSAQALGISDHRALSGWPDIAKEDWQDYEKGCDRDQVETRKDRLAERQPVASNLFDDVQH